MTPWLGGKSVLIVEDEFLIGLMLIKEITGVGGTSLGPVTSVADALKEIESRPVDAVILDAKLVDGSAADLAACLDARRDPLCGGQRLRQGKPAERTETGALRRQAHIGAGAHGSDRRVGRWSRAAVTVAALKPNAHDRTRLRSPASSAASRCYGRPRAIRIGSRPSLRLPLLLRGRPLNDGLQGPPVVLGSPPGVEWRISRTSSHRPPSRHVRGLRLFPRRS